MTFCKGRVGRLKTGPDGAFAQLMEPVKRQFGRLHIEAADLAARGVNSPLFSLAYLALKAGGAKDWYSGLGVSLWSVDKYREFLTYRRERLAARMNEFIREKAGLAEP